MRAIYRRPGYSHRCVLSPRVVEEYLRKNEKGDAKVRAERGLGPHELLPKTLDAPMTAGHPKE